MIAYIRQMYRAIRLTEPDKDLHRFVWRDKPCESLRDFRMTSITFGSLASSFIANMGIKQNVMEFGSQYLRAAKQVETSFYVDDYFGGADSQQEATRLQGEMHSLFLKGGFVLCKWNSSEPFVLESIPTDLRNSQVTVILTEPDQFTKILPKEWNASTDHFRVSVSELPSVEYTTKRSLISDVAKKF